jgi:hypothetical protein
MKKLSFAIAIVFLYSVQLFTQDFSIKDYSLKDYIAPDIKYRLLDMNTGLQLNGYNNYEESNYYNNYFNADLNFNHYCYKNTSKFQGINDLFFYTSFYSTHSKADSVKESRNQINLHLNYYSQNRFYNQNKAFLGLHGAAYLGTSPAYNRSGDSKYNYMDHSINIMPYISGGKGRIQPVQSARQAMDILIALQKSNRLAKNLERSLIDSLAHIVNTIRYKRFYDSRFKTIYQLEQLDQALKKLGLVDTADIIYFTNLNDIWNYALSYERGAGTRFEGGIIPLVTMYYYKNENKENSNIFKENNNDFGLYGFLSFNLLKPINYKWQSDLMIDLSFGYEKYINRYESNDYTNKTNGENLKGLFIASWQLGYYPNTRTYASVTPYLAVSYNNKPDEDTDKFGYNTGFDFNAYYYLSARLRLRFLASLFYVKDFNYSGPSPFWNSVTFTSISRAAFQATNEVIAFPVTKNNYIIGNEIQYSLNFSLSYAIF